MSKYLRIHNCIKLYFLKSKFTRHQLFSLHRQLKLNETIIFSYESGYMHFHLFVKIFTSHKIFNHWDIIVYRYRFFLFSPRRGRKFGCPWGREIVLYTEKRRLQIRSNGFLFELIYVINNVLRPLCFDDNIIAH